MSFLEKFFLIRRLRSVARAGMKTYKMGVYWGHAGVAQTGWNQAQDAYDEIAYIKSSAA